MKKNSRLIIILVSILILGGYILTILLFKNQALFGDKISSLKPNEFGDYIGGLLNPLFTLVSTVAIIFLSINIANRDSNHAKDSLILQKRLTLNQMRHETIAELRSKLNAFAYELDKLHINDAKNKFTQSFISTQIKKENLDNGVVLSNVWLITMQEMAIFQQQNYLFAELFKDDSFNSKLEELADILGVLATEYKESHFNTTANLENFLNLQGEIIRLIGEFILKDF